MKADHVVVTTEDAEHLTLRCLRCKAVLKLRYPIACDELGPLGSGFVRRHRGCRAAVNRLPADTDKAEVQHGLG